MTRIRNLLAPELSFGNQVARETLFPMDDERKQSLHFKDVPKSEFENEEREFFPAKRERFFNGGISRH